jgi:hypothetical protein
MSSAVAEMTGVCHHTQLFSLEMGSHKLFFAGLELLSTLSHPPA